MAGRAGELRVGEACDQKAEVAAYVASLSGDLSQLSRRNGLKTLAYLLDMARLQAETEARADIEIDQLSSVPWIKIS